MTPQHTHPRPAWPYTLHDPTNTLQPEDFTTIHDAITRTTQPPWTGHPWTITDPAGRTAMTPSRLHAHHERKAGLA